MTGNKTQVENKVVWKLNMREQKMGRENEVIFYKQFISSEHTYNWDMVLVKTDFNKLIEASNYLTQLRHSLVVFLFKTV